MSKPPKTKLRRRLVALYGEMAALTLPKCAQGCSHPSLKYSCCSPEYCEMARDYAKEEWGVELQPTTHDRLPFMGPTGCVVPAHLRPLCTLHNCRINSIGFDVYDPTWSKKYLKLRDEITEVECLLARDEADHKEEAMAPRKLGR